MSEDREEFEKRIGTVLRGKWRLDRLIGVGGMAAVYAATHSIGRQEAIKILHPDIARNKDLRARFEREAHAVNKFQHPGVVEIRDIDHAEDGSPFLVMELLDGEPLWDRAQRLGTIDPPELLRITDDLLDVLAAAHAQGIIHRDIKPDNLFVLRDGRIKVLDFGIAHLRDGVRTELRTRAGATLGTVSYMAPEQVKGTGVDQRADLFAVGATMFRIVARRRLHESRTESELLVKMATQPAPRLGTVASSAPPGLCLIVDRALAFEKERRYPDARTMQQDVRAARRGELPAYAMAQLSEGHLPGASASAPLAPTPSAPQPSAPQPSAPQPSAPQRAPLPSLPTAVPSSVVAGGGAAVQASFAPTLIQDAGSEISLSAPPRDSLPTSSPAAPKPSTPLASGPPPSVNHAPSGVASTVTATATYTEATVQRRSLNVAVILSIAGALLTLLVIGGLYYALGDHDEASPPASEQQPSTSAAPAAATPLSTADPQAAVPDSPAALSNSNLSAATAEPSSSASPAPPPAQPPTKAPAPTPQGQTAPGKQHEVNTPWGKIKLPGKR
ncbi:serine/threonine protein kinase [Chondromyces apiculatus]|uniref:Serine/threonine protein kinase PknB n=1 Tax=Chondromyces apiculatus DSM 436 TaxID=1192034 RepID=A0A017TD84_9BACT|nr:serine/threonine-protein kinase [Chondromyces apiculatus]EYF06887.1 Serine/threonine protein kinase PknB [Chondromyces apiculatus DSM 436]